jgi:hypothetical protein
MSEYELLKKLRERGYPQVFKPGTVFCAEDGQSHQSKISTSDPAEFELADIVVRPLFEELRAACDANSLVKGYFHSLACFERLSSWSRKKRLLGIGSPFVARPWPRLGRVLINRDCSEIAGCPKRHVKVARESSGSLLPPSPPAEQATACQDQAGQASSHDGARDGRKCLSKFQPKSRFAEAENGFNCVRVELIARSSLGTRGRLPEGSALKTSGRLHRFLGQSTASLGAQKRSIQICYPELSRRHPLCDDTAPVVTSTDARGTFVQANWPYIVRVKSGRKLSIISNDARTIAVSAGGSGLIVSTSMERSNGAGAEV